MHTVNVRPTKLSISWLEVLANIGWPVVVVVFVLSVIFVFVSFLCIQLVGHVGLSDSQKGLGYGEDLGALKFEPSTFLHGC